MIRALLGVSIHGVDKVLYYILRRIRPQHMVVNRDLPVILKRGLLVLELLVKVHVLNEVVDHGAQAMQSTHHRICFVPGGPCGVRLQTHTQLCMRLAELWTGFLLSSLV
jgi:hypothetical protein